MDTYEQDERQELLATWKSLKEPKPGWEAFKRLSVFSKGDIKKAIDIWRRTKNS